VPLPEPSALNWTLFEPLRTRMRSSGWWHGDEGWERVSASLRALGYCSASATGRTVIQTELRVLRGPGYAFPSTPAMMTEKKCSVTASGPGGPAIGQIGSLSRPSC